MTTDREQYEARRVTLQNERSTWLSHWLEIGQYIMPEAYRNVSTDTNKGTKKQQYIIDSTATFAADTLASGMMSGITSPSRPWMMLASPDPDMMEYEPVKVWLDKQTRTMLDIFHKSNIYNTLHRIYSDIGCFGTACTGILDDDRDVIRGYDFPIGSYVIGANDRREVDTFMRDPFPMTVRNLVRRFGIDNVCPETARKFNTGKHEDKIDIIHVVVPNPDYDAKMIHSRFKRWLSCYYEVAAPKEKVLGKMGFDEFPILAPRWDTRGEDVWGRGPGMKALGDAKSLQSYEKKTATAVEKMVNPPMVAPTSLRTQRVSQLPGDITYTDMGQVGAQSPALRPLHEVQFRIAEAEQKSAQIRERLNRVFYADLFLMMANDDRSQPITAREIAERHEEKLLALGPVLERLNGELLKPLIDRTFSIMLRRGMVEPPPQELRGADLRVEYISIMAQAQKMVGLAGLERTVNFAVSMAEVNPEIMDKIDGDQVLDVYGDNVGLPPGIIRSDEDVAARRQQRQQAQAQQAQAEQGALMAKSARDLAASDTEGKNGLTDFIAATTGA